MMDLQTTYLGLTLKNPLIVSACRLSESIENIKEMEKAGAAAVVMSSIFEEEISYNDEFIEHFMNFGTESFAESLTYFPRIEDKRSLLDAHLSHLSKAVESVNIPIIGSLNAITHEGWLDYAVKMQDTGIRALEINLYHFPAQGESSQELEKNYLDIIKKVKKTLEIPLVIKLSPFFTSIFDFVLKLEEETKTDGVVLFNRFYYPDFDINTLNFKSDIQLSHSYEARLPLRWIAILRNNIKASIVASTGVENTEDLIKYLLAGADAVMCASCLMRNDIGYLHTLLFELESWLSKKQFHSVKEIQGLLSQNLVANKKEWFRVQYMHALRSFSQADKK